jgi:hypothetical protein
VGSSQLNARPHEISFGNNHPWFLAELLAEIGAEVGDSFAYVRDHGVVLCVSVF